MSLLLRHILNLNPLGQIIIFACSEFTEPDVTIARIYLKIIITGGNVIKVSLLKL